MFGTAQTAEELATIVTIDEETIELWQKAGRGRHGWERNDIEEAVKRVNRGSLLLDEKKPDWVFGVIPARLDMSCASLCIIGQTYGNFDAVAIPFGMQEMLDDHVSDEDSEKIDKLAIEHGFLTFHGGGVSDVPYGVLDRVWVTMLTERHNRGGERVLLAMPEQN